jgi:hypothetical protein
MIPDCRKPAFLVMLIIMGNTFQEAITILQMSEDAVETNYNSKQTRQKILLSYFFAVAGKYNISGQ